MASWRPAAVVLAALGSDHESATQTLRALTDAAPTLPVFVGGPFVGEAPGGAQVLPPSFAAAVAAFALAVPGSDPAA